MLQPGISSPRSQAPACAQVARRHAEDYCRHTLGYAACNMDFVQGHMELLEKAGIGAGAYDLIISNCVVNLSPDKAAVLRGAYRALAPGGEMYFSDVYCDRRVPEEARKDEVRLGADSAVVLQALNHFWVVMYSNRLQLLQQSHRKPCIWTTMQHVTLSGPGHHLPVDPKTLLCCMLQVLWGECVSGALYVADFLRIARAAGFAAPIELQRSPIAVSDPAMAALLGGARFCSITYRCTCAATLQARCRHWVRAAAQVAVPPRGACMGVEWRCGRVGVGGAGAAWSLYAGGHASQNLRCAGCSSCRACWRMPVKTMAKWRSTGCVCQHGCQHLP